MGVGLNKANKEKAIFLDPKLFGLEVTFFRTDDKDGLALPDVVVDFGEIKALALHLIDGGLGRLAVNVKPKHQKHVDKGATGDDTVVFEAEYGTVSEQPAVGGIKLADIDAEFSGEQKGLVPDLRAVGSVCVVGGGFLLEAESVVPVVGVAVVHSTEDGGAVMKVLGVDPGRKAQSEERKNVRHSAEDFGPHVSPGC